MKYDETYGSDTTLEYEPRINHLEDIIKTLSGKIECLESSTTPRYWSITRTEPIDYFNFSKKIVEKHNPGWICDILYKDCSSDEVKERVKENFGPGVYSISLDDSFGRTITNKNITITCEDYGNSTYNDISGVDRTLVYTIYNSIKSHLPYYALEDLIHLVVSRIERSSNLRVRGGFLDLSILSEDVNVNLKDIIAIVQKYIELNNSHLRGLISIKEIFIESLGNVTIIKRKRWDWV